MKIACRVCGFHPMGSGNGDSTSFNLKADSMAAGIRAALTYNPTMIAVLVPLGGGFDKLVKTYHGKKLQNLKRKYAK